MSKWRQKGFVQDSDDEEEELQFESQGSRRHGDKHRRVERVELLGAIEGIHDAGQEENNIEAPNTDQSDIVAKLASGGPDVTTPVKHDTLRQPTLSPFTPKCHALERESPESPDPLQGPSPQNTYILQTNNTEADSPIFLQQLTTPAAPTAGNAESPLQDVPLSTSRSPLPNMNHTGESKAATTFLGTFGLAPLSDDSDDEDLSDPPSDMELSPPPYVEPHRRTTAQIVIPSSTALQRQTEQHWARREFRQRKPIQLHPYALEGELYRREVQSRGLKPVARERSPSREPRPTEAETQEKDFDPQASPTSSPPEIEIPVSTPVPRRVHVLSRSGQDRQHTGDGSKRPSATQLRHPHASKKRRINLSLAQTAVIPRQASEETALPHDIWSIPPNSPPLSSSPPWNGTGSARRPGRLRITSPRPALPTPTTSSVFQDDLPLIAPGSDSDSIPMSGQKDSGTLRRPPRVVLDDSSSSNSGSSSEAEQADQELNKVRRKIKGVLPASWLRIDKQAQERRQARLRELERERERASVDYTQSPGPTEPQKGVAQRIVRHVRHSRETNHTSTCQSIISISEGSESELESSRPVFNPSNEVKSSVNDAFAIAAMLDSRYADQDPSDMEDNELHLPTLGRTSATRKKQFRLADSFERAKRIQSSNTSAKVSGNRKRHGADVVGRRKLASSRRNHRASLPALSVIDMDISPSSESCDVPDFLRVARRQALRRPDFARQSLRHKQIRLHNAQDTEDANMTLQQWHHGRLKPQANPRLRSSQARIPLIETADNHQRTPGEPGPVDVSSRSKVRIENEHFSSGLELRLSQPPGLGIFQRAASRKPKPSRSASNSLVQIQKAHRASRRSPLPFRTAQLESDEMTFGRAHRKTAFENALQRVETQFEKPIPLAQPHMNPLLARFLTEDDTSLPPLPSAKDIGESSKKCSVHQRSPSRKRQARKKLARRVDVEAREFRQPSEPAAHDVLNASRPDLPEVDDVESEIPILQGLGPYGSRYPISFDVFPLSSETYFHSTTFIGSDEFRKALQLGLPSGRNLEDPAGYNTIVLHSVSIRCGPWNDETSSGLQDETRQLIDRIHVSHLDEASLESTLTQSSVFLRNLINHISVYLSFSDPIDRRDFVAKMIQLTQSIFESVSFACAMPNEHRGVRHVSRIQIRSLAYLLVVGIQILRIAQHSIIDKDGPAGAESLLRSISQVLVANLIQYGVSELGNFLEQNKLQKVKELGVQENDMVVESTVICIQSLININLPGLGFWNIVNQKLGSSIANATRLVTFETTWATIFTFLPFTEVDISGILARKSFQTFQTDDWCMIRDMMKRLFDLYPSTFNKNGSSLNSYVRANLSRCFRLIKQWNWHRPELVLNSIFDYYGKNGLRLLRREASNGSVSFLQDGTMKESLNVDVDENSFHIALKCLALGLKRMRETLPEKKIRSFVFRTIPNHGRAYPKDQSLDEDNLAALRNHHDLLSTLYWGAPASCRPKLDHIRNLVDHENSHREACRLNVRAWVNLTVFQVQTDEPYTSLEPFAFWHKDIMHQTLKQYRLAKVEADDYLKSGVLDGTSDVSLVMVRQTMQRNQEQVIATLQDCIAGMKRVVQCAHDQSLLRDFLVSSDVVFLLELPHFEDRRLVSVIRDVLALLQEYAKRQEAPSSLEDTQTRSEESQDYGDFPDMEELEDIDSDITMKMPSSGLQQTRLDFVQQPLWRLLSNAFGAESAPDDNLLMSCIDTWVCIAECQVASGQKTWSHYLDGYSQVSWKQLRATDQTRKFGPYFLTAVIERSVSAYFEFKEDMTQALLVSLAERESLLRFQHRLLHAILRADPGQPVLQNLPFFRDQSDGQWDITAETLCTRRLALISSILSNMRDTIGVKLSEKNACAADVRRSYATMLKDFMAAMRSNYLALQQASAMSGAYVEFVQKIVQFLKQYTSDICPVLPFFTDSVAFPLPAGDPTYVVGRLCGYAPKAQDVGTNKQLSVFVQTVVQQAAADNQQSYLVEQLITALCTEEAPAADRVALRAVLLEGIFPAYTELALSSATAFVVSEPCLRAMPTILETMMFDIRLTQPEQLKLIVSPIMATFHSYIRASEQLKHDPFLFTQPWVLAGLSYMFEAATAMLPLVSYMCERTFVQEDWSRPALIQYMEQLSIFIAEMVHNLLPHSIPTYLGDVDASPSSKNNIDLLAFCKRGLNEALTSNWSEVQGAIWFGAGHNRREITMDIGTVEGEKQRLIRTVELFHGALNRVYTMDTRSGNEAYPRDDVFV